MIPYDELMALKAEQTFSWTPRDVMIYALGIGMARDPMDEKELDFVYDEHLKVVPTFAVTIPFNGGCLTTGHYDYALALHGEIGIEVHAPLPASGTVTGRSRMTGAWDKGPGKGAVATEETVLYDQAGDPLVTVLSSVFARGDGGFTKNYKGTIPDQPPPHPIPERAPDATIDIPTLPNQALLYRQSGDANPLHADPKAAKKSGFDRPILHGLCTYAITCRAVLQTYCDYDPDLIRHHSVRFSAPVYPGETITVDMWRDGDVVSFEARIKARNITVIKNGKSRLRPA